MIFFLIKKNQALKNNNYNLLKFGYGSNGPSGFVNFFIVDCSVYVLGLGELLSTRPKRVRLLNDTPGALGRTELSFGW